MAQTQVDVSANALHRLYGQRAAQVLSVRPRRGQAEAKPAGQKDTDSRFKITVNHSSYIYTASIAENDLCQQNMKISGDEVENKCCAGL